MDKHRNAILQWAEQGRLDGARVEQAMRHAGALPDGAAWRRFLDRLLLWSGAALVAAGVIFFIAFNWDLLGRVARFGLVEALIVAAVAVSLLAGTERPAGKAALLAAALFVGALLALFGQTYQTGADTFELFAIWALMIAPWVLVGAHASLWMLLVLLIDVAIVFYFRAHPRPFGLFPSAEITLWSLFGFQVAALAAWEAAARRHAWLAGRWGPRLLAAAGGSLITLLALTAIFDGDNGVSGLPIYGCWLGAIYWFYRRVQRDLFMLAGGVLTAVVVVASLLTRVLFDRGGEEGAMLLIGLIVIGMSAAAGRWLMAVAREDGRDE